MDNPSTDNIRRLEQRFHTEQTLVVMPAGAFALSFADELVRMGKTVSVVLDNFKAGERCRDGRIEIHHPAILKTIEFDAVFIATPSLTVQEDMREQLVEIIPGRKADIVTLFDLTSGDFDAVLMDHVRSITGHHAMAGDRKKICLTTPFFHHNFLKLIKYLKKDNFHVTVITGHEYINSALSVLEFRDRGFYDLCLVVEHYDVIMPKILELTTFDVVHAILTTASAIPLKRALEKSNAVFVTDYCDFHQILYDDEATYLKFMSERQLNREKESWRNLFTRSDGLIIKDSPEIIGKLSEHYGQGPRNVLEFHSYASLDFSPLKNSVPVKGEGQGKIRIVYAGCVVNDPSSHAYPVVSSLHTIAESLDRQGIGFDIYNAIDTTGKGFESYLELAERLTHFNYHFAVPQDRLAQVLSVYDLGWFGFDFSMAMESEFFLKTTFGSKVFNYLEAGLPVIVAGEAEYMAGWVESHHVGIGIRYSEVDSLASRLDPECVADLKRKVLENLGHLSMEHHIKRLTTFYDDLEKSEKRNGTHV